jgi:hypothetical protein
MSIELQAGVTVSGLPLLWVVLVLLILWASRRAMKHVRMAANKPVSPVGDLAALPEPGLQGPWTLAS